MEHFRLFLGVFIYPDRSQLNFFITFVIVVGFNFNKFSVSTVTLFCSNMARCLELYKETKFLLIFLCWVVIFKHILSTHLSI